MGGRKYYCEYCERGFKDVHEARKKHLMSLEHVKNRDAYYSQFKSPEIILAAESVKRPCSRFFRNGDCQFGTLCRFSHYTHEQIEQLRAMVAARAQMPATRSQPQQTRKVTLENFFEPDDFTDEQLMNPWPQPPELANRPDLPPSLRPISYLDFLDCEFAEWGWT